MGSKKKKLRFMSILDSVLFAYGSRHSSTAGDLSFSDFYYDMNGYYNKDTGVTYMYTIDGYPNSMDTSFRTDLRRECKGDVRISFISLLDSYKIDWNSNQMQAKLRGWQILDETQAEVSDYNMHKNIQDMDNIEWRKLSLRYLNDAVLRRKRKTFRFRCAVLVSGTRGTDFDESIESIEDYCKQRGIKLTRVLYNVYDYLGMFSPFRLGYNTKLEKEIGNVVLTDELLARYTTFSQGKVGKSGEYWGTDIFSCFACLKPTKVKNTDAETWLITGETGSGKSYFGKGLIIQLLAKPYINGTINDVEGFEYTELLDFATDADKMVLLNMAEGQGLYVDPVPIILTGDDKSDETMYSMSVSFTTVMFRAMVGTLDEHLQIWSDIIIDEAVSRTYSSAGVEQEDMSTWSNSDNLSIFDVYANIKEMLINPELNQTELTEKVFNNAVYIDALQVVVGKLSRYFEENGTLRGTFKKRVSLEEIAHAKLVINSFGMAGKSPDTVDKVQMSLMQMYAANISHIRSIFSKVDGKYNFKVWEEFQRWGTFPNSERIITTALTGGRKLGDINIIMTNKVKDLLDDDKFGIFGNISSVAVGCIWDSKVRHDLCERLSMLNFESDLDTLVSKNKQLLNYVDGDTVQDSAYSKAFLIGLDKTYYTISKMNLPDEWDSMSLFQTGVELKCDEDDE